MLKFKDSMAKSVADMTQEERTECIVDLLGEVKRDGMDKLIEFLKRSDFFAAPASTRFHLSVPGGLATHSLHVYYRLYEMMCHDGNLSKDDDIRDVMDSIAIVGLLHDVCKISCYKQELGSRKTGRTKPNGKPEWEDYTKYVFDDSLPMGHGEKSLYMIQGFIPLKREEAIAIRWHMGFSDNDFKAGGQALQKAFEMYPLAVAAHIADLEATYIDDAAMDAERKDAESKKGEAK